MKRLILCVFLCFVCIKIYAAQLIHNYYGDFKEVVRIVFVLNNEVFYNTLMDTDNKALYISISDAQINPSLLTMNFDDQPLIDNVFIEKIGNDIKISILTSVVYYAESFFLIDSHFKIVLDIFRQREPSDLDSAKEYLKFFQTVGYRDRAAELQRRINRNDFIVPVNEDLMQSEEILPKTVESQVLRQEEKMPVIKETETPANRLADPLLYIRPDLSTSDKIQSEWINRAFSNYTIFKEIDDILKRSEATIIAYDNARTVEISFIEAMSRQYNSLSELNIRLNEVRLNLNTLIQRPVVNKNNAVNYTETMIRHILNVLPDYQTRIINVQQEYRKRLNY